MDRDSVFSETLRELASHGSLLGAPWRPHISSAGSIENIAAYVERGATGISVPGIAAALRLACPHVKSILISLPPVAGEVPLLDRVSDSVELVVAVDHFVQAEYLAKHARLCGRPLTVALLLQSNLPGPGIRPGQDALQLARGICELPGLQIAGVTVDVSGDEAAYAAIKAAEHTQRLFRETGIQCDFVSVTVDQHQRIPDAARFTDVCIRTKLPTQEYGVQETLLQAEVISRPSLELVVLNVGEAVLGPSPNIQLSDHDAATVTQWMDDCCVVTATGTAQQLTIGDQVRITTGSALK